MVTIDVNTEIYPIAEGDKIELLLSEQLRPGGSAAAASGAEGGEGAGDGGGAGDAGGSVDGIDDATVSYDPTLPLGDMADQFDYIMYGRIFKFAEEKSKAYVFFPPPVTPAIFHSFFFFPVLPPPSVLCLPFRTRTHTYTLQDTLSKYLIIQV